MRAIVQLSRIALLGAACTAAVAASPPANHRNFVSCPIVRDTASVPCWLAEYDGELYFLTLQTDVSAPVTPPWLGHKVLVEGVVSDEPRICGGIVLKPVTLSVLPELDRSCDTILPAEDRYNLTFEPPRPPGPSKGRLAFDRTPPTSREPAKVTGMKEFEITYDFDGLVGFRHPRSLTQVLNHARAIDASRIEIVGYRGATLLSNGEVFTERSGIAQSRAQQVAQLLRGVGLTQPTYKVSWEEKPASVDGDEDFSTRRVLVRVHP